MFEKAKPIQNPFGGGDDSKEKEEKLSLKGERPLEKKKNPSKVQEMIATAKEKKKKLRPRSICGC